MLDHGAALSGRLSAIEIVLENGSDALVGERPDGERASRDGFGASRVDAAEQAQHTEASSKALFRMRAASTAITSASVFGPIERAQRWKRAGDHAT